MNTTVLDVTEEVTPDGGAVGSVNKATCYSNLYIIIMCFAEPLNKGHLETIFSPFQGFFSLIFVGNELDMAFLLGDPLVVLLYTSTECGEM